MNQHQSPWPEYNNNKTDIAVRRMRSFQNNQSINRSTDGLLKITKSVTYNHLGYNFSLHTNKIATQNDPIDVRTIIISPSRFEVHFNNYIGLKKNNNKNICFPLLMLPIIDFFFSCACDSETEAARTHRTYYDVTLKLLWRHLFYAFYTFLLLYG